MVTDFTDIHVGDSRVREMMRQIDRILEEEAHDLDTMIKILGKRMGIDVSRLRAEVHENRGGKFIFGYELVIVERKNFFSSPVIFSYFVEYAQKKGVHKWYDGSMFFSEEYHDLLEAIVKSRSFEGVVHHKLSELPINHLGLHVKPRDAKKTTAKILNLGRKSTKEDDRDEHHQHAA